MGRALFVLALVSGCYDPSPLAGSPCSPSGTCPATLVCTDGVCLLPGVGADAHDDATDDAPVIDGAIDAPATDAAPAGWSTPVALVGVNTPSAETDPSLTADGLEMYFVSDRAGGVGLDDLWFTKRASLTSPWAAPTNLAALSSAVDDSSVEVSPAGDRLWFVSDRTGSGDVYTSERTVLGGWSAPTLVSELSTTGAESGIGVSPDGLTVILDRDGSAGRTQHIATRAAIDLKFGATSQIAATVGLVDPASSSLTNHADIVYVHAGATRDIYRMTRTGASWTPQAPVSEVNTTMRDAAPWVPQTDDHMVFERAGQLYETRR